VEKLVEMVQAFALQAEVPVKLAAEKIFRVHLINCSVSILYYTLTAFDEELPCEVG